LRDAAFRGLREAEWGSELGRLYVIGAISSAQYGAGRRWTEDAARWRAALDVRPLRTANLERGALGHPADPDSPEGVEEARRDSARMERFFEAHAELMRVGRGAEAAVRRLCEDDLSLAGMEEFRLARAGLLALSIHYGITKHDR